MKSAALGGLPGPEFSDLQNMIEDFQEKNKMLNSFFLVVSASDKEGRERKFALSL